jgi:protein-S-isoprenylcysteine O-methyltransferase Ste14
MILSAIIVFLSLAVYGLIHSLMASLPVKAWARRQFGLAADRYYRIVFNWVGLLSFLPVLALAGVLPGKTLYRLHLPWTLLTLGLQLCAVLAVAVGVMQIGAASFLGLRPLIVPVETTPPSLVTTGLYRFVRHPLYTAGILFIWASPVMTTNLLALYIGATIYFVVGSLDEEYRMRREFGDAYREYCRRTPMLIPFLRVRSKN